MADLHLTPTRRQLLKDIDRGLVTLAWDNYYVPAPATQAGRMRVTAGVRELVRAGLAVEPDPPTHRATPMLTDAGRAALEGGPS